jgi:hypothetical protein
MQSGDQTAAVARPARRQHGSGADPTTRRWKAELARRGVSIKEKRHMNDDIIITADRELACPSCGGTHLHHDRVISYERDEDAPTTVRVTVENAQAAVAVVSLHGCGNPSERRHGLAVRFWCEECPATPEFCIAQHKGCDLPELAQVEHSA